jgi:hypothetical protein
MPLVGKSIVRAAWVTLTLLTSQAAEVQSFKASASVLAVGAPA